MLFFKNYIMHAQLPIAVVSVVIRNNNFVTQKKKYSMDELILGYSMR